MTPHRGIGVAPDRNLAQEDLTMRLISSVHPESGLLALPSPRPS